MLISQHFLLDFMSFFMCFSMAETRETACAELKVVLGEVEKKKSLNLKCSTEEKLTES